MNLAQRIGQEFKTLRENELALKLDSETVTSLLLDNGSLKYTDELGTVTNIDLSGYLDEDSRSIASGVLSNGTITFTRDDSTTFTLDVSALLDDTNLVSSVAGKTGTVTLAKADVGLGNVDNTSDANKPISSAAETALNTKVKYTDVLTAVTDMNKVITQADLPTETITSLNLVGNELRYVNEIGSTRVIDLSLYLDDTNLARIISGVYNSTSKTLDFMRDDSSTFSIDASAFFDDTNMVTSVAGKTGVVTLVKADVGLSNVDNTSDANKPVSTATQTALNLKANLASPTFTGTVAGITKTMVGLGSVDNTTDLLKPVSTATQTALNLKANLADVYSKTETDTKIQNVIGAAPAALDTLAEIASELTDNDSVVGALITTVSGKANIVDVYTKTEADTSLGLKVDKITGKGLSTEDYSTIEKTKLSGIESGAQVNTVTSVAGKTGVVTLVKADVGLGSVDNTSDANKPVSTATQTALNLKANLASPTFTGTVVLPSTTSIGTTTKSEFAYLEGVTSSIQPQLDTKLSKSGGTMTGAITAIRETKVAMVDNNIDLATGNVFTKSITTTTTLTVSNVLATGNANSFILELTNAGAYTITWFSGVKWAGGTAPTLTASGVDILGFYSHDGGTTWRGAVLSKDSK
jgi:hypothetical protein